MDLLTDFVQFDWYRFERKFSKEIFSNFFLLSIFVLPVNYISLYISWFRQYKQKINVIRKKKIEIERKRNFETIFDYKLYLNWLNEFRNHLCSTFSCCTSFGYWWPVFYLPKICFDDLSRWYFHHMFHSSQCFNHHLFCIIFCFYLDFWIKSSALSFQVDKLINLIFASKIKVDYNINI